MVNSFTWCINHYGPPQSTLTDNGLVYTTRRLKGLNKFETPLITLDIRQKNGSPYHPQTQGKVERFHHTEHLWVNARPPAETISQLQAILDEFQHVYNTQRPHRALNRDTTHQWYHRTLKARPNLIDAARNREFRIRYDRIDKGRLVTLRHDGKLCHVGAAKSTGARRGDTDRHRGSHRAGPADLGNPRAGADRGL